VARREVRRQGAIFAEADSGVHLGDSHFGSRDTLGHRVGDHFRSRKINLSNGLEEVDGYIL
jgi:hypothetical protein